MGQGCLGGTKTAASPDGGVFKTATRAESWTQKPAFISGAKISAEAGKITVNSMAFDPQDEKVIYLATAEHGLVYSFDAGDSWRKADTLKIARVQTVAVDPKNKCVVYATAANKVYKTENCMRDWRDVFFDPRTEKVFTQLLVDWFNPTVLYAGTSEGDVFKSTDAGRSWRVIKRVEGAVITSLALDPRDSRILYAGTNGSGIFKTLDGGATWLQVKKQLGEEFRDARRVTQAVVDPQIANLIYLVSKYGVIKSPDQGETWQAMSLPIAPGAAEVTYLAIDRKDNKKLFLIGPDAFLLSVDGGASWTSKRLPTTRAGSVLLISPADSNLIYLGTKPQVTK
jgi:photosystem II stability/assembly factor-like uncharacterized protein